MKICHRTEKAIRNKGEKFMLKIIGIASPDKERLEIDHWVLSINWDNKPTNQPIYWRSGGFNKSLIEIGIFENTGEIVSVTLVAVEHVHVWELTHPNRDANVPHETGIPVCDIKPWNLDDSYDSTFLDEPSELQVYLAQNAISIQLGESTPISYWISSGRFTFGVSQNGFLHLIQIHALNNQEMEFMKSIHNKHSPNLRRSFLRWYFNIKVKIKNIFHPKTD
jgi:hypothetical protein